MKGKRFLMVDGINSGCMLDETRIKRVTKADAEVDGILWQAGIVVSDYGNAPLFNTRDPNFHDRVIIVPMRSKFVDELDETSRNEANTFVADFCFKERFERWLPALADMLVEHYDPRGLDVIPEVMKSVC